MSALEIKVVQSPAGITPILRKSTDIIFEVLTNCDYRHEWQLAFVRQHSKKVNIRFQFVRRGDDRDIHIRTRCGGKQTCWEAILTVPSQYDPEVVVAALRNINPRSLKPKGQPAQPQPKQTDENKPVVKTTTIRPAGFNKEITFNDLIGRAKHAIHQDKALDVYHAGLMFKSLHDHVGEKEALKLAADAGIKKELVLASIKLYLECSEPMLRSLSAAQAFQKFDCFPEEVAPEPVVLEDPQSAPVDEPVAVAATATGSLFLDPLEHTDVVRDSVVNDRALLALSRYLHLSGDKNTVERAVGTRAIIGELGLEEFCKKAPNYHHTSRTAAMVIKGLCDRGYITRWNCSGKSGSTKAYIFTPHGHARLQLLRAHVQIPDAPRPAAGPTIPVVREPDPHILPLKPLLEGGTKEDWLHRITVAGPALQELLTEYEKLASEEGIYDEFIQENAQARTKQQERISELERSRKGLPAEIEELEGQIKQLQEQLKLKNKRLEEIGDEIVREQNKMTDLFGEAASYKQEKTAHQDRLLELKNRMAAVLASGDTPQQRCEIPKAGA